jgi:hypothetical protein
MERTHTTIKGDAHQKSIEQAGKGEGTSGKKAISGAPFWTMHGAYGMRHHCHATSTYISVAHLNMRHA